LEGKIDCNGDAVNAEFLFVSRKKTMTGSVAKWAGIRPKKKMKERRGKK
jgi:hypothetical protein